MKFLYLAIKLIVLVLWCLMPLSTIFQIYCGGQFYWWKKRSTRRTNYKRVSFSLSGFNNPHYVLVYPTTRHWQFLIFVCLFVVIVFRNYLFVVYFLLWCLLFLISNKTCKLFVICFFNWGTVKPLCIMKSTRPMKILWNTKYLIYHG